MAEERKVQLGFAVDATGARAGFQEVKDASREMAQGVQQSAQQASKAIDGMGSGGGQAAQKVDGAARSIIGSIQRTTATMQAGEKGTASYYEALAGQRGVNSDILRPYLEQLLQVEAAQKSATAALTGGSTSMEKMGVSTGQTNAALRQLPAQLTDIVTSLQGGQKPLTVLIQQGGQIKDAFGGIGETFRALGGQAALMFPTIAAAMGGVVAQQQAMAEGAGAAAEGMTDIAAGANDAAEATKHAGEALNGVRGAAAGASSTFLLAIAGFVALAAGAAAVVVAYRQGAKESFAFETALLKTGNIIGTTTGQLREMAQAIGGAGDYTEGAAAAALTKIASTGKVAGESLQNFTEIALDMEEYVGQAVSDTAKIFAELGSEPTKAVLKLNESLHFLTLTQLEQIKALETHGDKTKAAQLAQEAYADAVKPTIDAYKANLDSLDIALNFWTDKGKQMWDALTGVGRKETGQDRIQKLRAQLAELDGPNPFKNASLSDAISGTFDAEGTKNKMRAGMQEQLVYLERVTQAAKENAGFEKERQRVQEAGIAVSDAVAKAQEKGLSKQAQMNKALEDYRENIEKIRAAAPESALLDAKMIAAGEKAIREQFKEKSSSGSAAAGESELATMRAKTAAARDYLKALQENGLAADKRNEFEAQASRLQKELEGSIKGVARANKEKTLAEALAGAEVQKSIDAKKALLKSTEESEQAYRKFLDSMMKTAAGIGEQADKQEAANAAFGKGKTAIEEMTLAQLRLARASEQDAGPWDPARLAAMDEAISQQERYVKSLQGGDNKVLSAHIDELLRNAKEMGSLYEDEMRLTGLTAIERAKVVAQRQVELKYAKELDKVERMKDGPEKEAERIRVLEAKQIESSAAVNKVVQDDWARTAGQIEQSLTDALLRGFESGKDLAKNLRDTVVNMFKTMVLRPIISAVMAPVAGAVSGIAQAATGGASALGVAGNAASVYSAGGALASLGAFGGAVSGFGTAALAATQSMLGITGTAAQMTASLAAAGHTAASGLAAGVNAFAAIPGWGWALAGVALLATMWDDGSGTPHSGAGAIYSDSGGLQKGADIYNRANFGMGATAEYNKGGQDFATGIATGLVNTLDGLAVAFGQKAGYEVAAAFGDDIGDDPSWGALRISKEGKDLLNWDATRTSKWAPREFADGEAGQKEYLAAIAKDTRQVLLDMDLPSWADTLLESIGEAASMEQLGQAVAQIGQIQTMFVQLGQTVDGFAGMGDKAFEALMKASGGADALGQNVGAFYQNFYTEEERMAKATATLTEELAKFGKPLPATKEAYRALFEEATKAGVGSAELAAKLLQLAPAFAQTADAAEQAQKEMVAAAGISGETIATTLRDALLGRVDTAEAGASIGQMVTDGIYNALASGFTQQLTDLMMTSLITPVIQAAIAGTSVSEAVSAGAIDNMIAAAGRAAEALDQIFSDQDFIAAIGRIGDAINGVVAGAAGGRGAGGGSAGASGSGDSLFAIGGSAVGGYMSPEFQAFGTLAEETIESNKKVSELLQKLLNPETLFENRYKQLDSIAADKRDELINVQVSRTQGYASTLNRLPGEIAADLQVIQELKDRLESGGTVADGVIEAMQSQLSGKVTAMAQLEKKLREWYLAQARVIAVEDITALSEDAKTATAKTAELKRTGGLEDPITKLKDSFTQKFAAIDEGINAALQAEIAARSADANDAKALMEKYPLMRQWQMSDDEWAKAKRLFGENIGRNMYKDEAQYMRDVIAQIEDGINAITAEQQTYIDSLNGWYKAQAELLSTEMLVDINQQIKALEAEEKGPLTTIKEAIQKYIDDLTALGNLDATAQAAIDKLSGLQLTAGRKALYDQLLSPEELKTRSSYDLNVQFAGLGQAMPATTEALRGMIDAARAAGNITLADSLLELVPAFVSLQGAADGVGDVLGNLRTATDDAFAALERAVGVQRDLLTETISDLQAVFDLTRDAARDLYGEVESARSMTAAAGRAFIDQALAAAQTTGYMPDADGLREAIDGVRKGIAAQQGATSFEAERDRLVLAGKLTDLKDLAEPQLTEAQRQLAALEEMLKTARTQIDELRGINNSVLSVAGAMTALAAAIAAEKAATPAQGPKSSWNPNDMVFIPGGGGGSSGANSINSIYQQLFGRDAETAGADYWASTGLSGAALETAIRGGALNDDKLNLPGFATGINVVPYDMTARIHEGEAVVPAQFNPFNPNAKGGGMGGNTARLEALVEGLTAEVQRLQSIVAKGVEHQRETAEILDNVTEGGSAMRAEVMA